MIAGEGILLDAYREKKLLDRYLETAAIKNDISLGEARLLLYLAHPHDKCTRKELADIMGMTRAGISMALQKLAGKGLVELRDNGNKREAEEKNSVRQLDIGILKAADSIVEDLLVAQNDYRQMMFYGFDEEEIEQYMFMNEKIRANIQKALK